MRMVIFPRCGYDVFRTYASVSSSHTMWLTINVWWLDHTHTRKTLRWKKHHLDGAIFPRCSPNTHCVCRLTFSARNYGKPHRLTTTTLIIIAIVKSSANWIVVLGISQSPHRRFTSMYSRETNADSRREFSRVQFFVYRPAETMSHFIF